jgi:hypothetical protein
MLAIPTALLGPGLFGSASLHLSSVGGIRVTGLSRVTLLQIKSCAFIFFVYKEISFILVDGC